MKKISFIVFIMVLFSVFVILGCSRDEAVASVNGEQINRREIQRNIDYIISQDITGTLAYDEEQLEEAKSKILDSLIVLKLLEQHALELGLEACPETVQESYQRVVSKYSSEAELEEELKSRDICSDYLKNELGKQIVRDKLYEMVAAGTEISDQQVAQFYEDNKHRMFTEPEKVKVSHILAQFEGGASTGIPSESDKDEARSRIEEALRLLEGGRPFEEVARDLSDDWISAENGGDIGYISRGEMVEEFEQAAFMLEVGQLSDIVETVFGFHIIKVTDRQEEYLQEFDEVKETTISFLEDEQKNITWSDFIYELIDHAKIEYHGDIRSTLFLEEGLQ